MTMMLTDPLRWWGQEAPNDAAITFDGRDTITYGELDAWTDNTAHWLVDAGLKEGDRLGIVGVNSLEWCAVALGAMKVGAIVAPYNHRLVAEELSHLVESSEPTIVVAGDENRDRMEEVAHRGAAFSLLRIEDATPLRTAPRRPFERVEIDEDSPAVIVYTSGTTSRPKGVICTPRTVFGFIFEWSLMEPTWGKGAKMIFVLALAGMPGILYALVQTLAHGGHLFMETGFEPELALRRLIDEEIDIFMGVPVLFEQIASLPAFADAEFPALKATTVGGARVAQPCLEAWLAKGVALRQIWGMTEVGGSVTATNKEDAYRRPESFGRGSVFTRIRVVRPDGTECDPGEMGEIICRGPAVTPGYWRNEAATKEALVDGWMHSGDIGIRDEQGYVRMVDRMKDMIISGGYNIAPAELESVIGQLPAVEEVAVIAVDDDKFGETPAAIVRRTADLAATDVVAYCNHHLAGYKVPRYIVFVDEPLPRFASGKLAKRELREKFASIPSTHEKVR